jgi:hypothetical protein
LIVNDNNRNKIKTDIKNNNYIKNEEINDNAFSSIYTRKSGTNK